MNNCLFVSARLGPYALVFSALVFSLFFYESYQLPKAAIFTAYAVFFAFASLRRQAGAIKLHEILFILLYIFNVSYSLLSPHNPPAYLAAAALAPAAFFISCYSGVNRRAFLLFVSCAIVASSFYSIVQYAQHGVERPFSFFGNPIFAAEFTALLLPFTVAGLLTARSEKPVHYAALCLGAGAFVLYSSRGAGIALLAAFLSLIFFLRPRLAGLLSLKTCGMAAAVLIAFLLLLPGFSGSLASFFNRSVSAADTSSPAVMNRIAMGEAAVSLWKKSPLTGNGHGSYAAGFQKEQAALFDAGSPHSFIKTGQAHNDYLQMLAEKGAVGLILFLAAVFSAVYFFEKRAPLIAQDEFIFKAAAFSSVIAGLSAAFFNFPFHSLPSSFIVFCSLGFICAPENRPAAAHPLSRAGAVLAASIALPAVISAFSGFTSATAADFYLKKAVDSGTYADRFFSRAVALDPANFHVLYHYAAHKTLSGDRASAIRLMKQSLKYHPYSADTLHNTGALYAAEGNHTEALVYYRAAISLHPLFPEANRGAFVSLSSLGREDEAVKYLEPAALSGSLKALHDSLGITLKEQPND